MGPRHAAVHISVAVVALALAVALVLWRLDREPWPHAAALVRAETAPGELVVLTPAFHYREAHAFRGLPVVAADSLSSVDARRFPGVWVVAAAPLPQALERPLARLGEPVRSTVGPLTVLHWRPREEAPR